jgi:hypothetical protein
VERGECELHWKRSIFLSASQLLLYFGTRYLGKVDNL